MSAATRVYLELGRSQVFASALDWPGWCRRGRGEAGALAALAASADRYGRVAGPGFAPGPLEVVGRVAGGAGPDFGAPMSRTPWDEEPLDPAEAHRFATLLEAAWLAFDSAVAMAPSALRRGPRGGGRDRDAIAEHVREAERTYARKVELRLPPRTPWSAQREALASTVRAGGPMGAWTLRQAVRRGAWHVLDHAWEIEDRSG